MKSFKPAGDLTRRDFVISSAAVAGTGISVGVDAVAPALAGKQSAVGLKHNRTIPFGAATRTAQTRKDEQYKNALIHYCDQVVSEGNMKWVSIRPEPGKFDFRPADAFMKFAKQNQLEPRGHTLCWYAALPDWAKRIAAPDQAERELREHIEKVVGRYRGQIRSWDVVNEAVADKSGQPFDLRPSVWSAALGPRHVDIAFRAAHAADPTCQLVLNENHLAMKGRKGDLKRQRFLTFLRGLKDRDVPVHAVGLQGHLPGHEMVDVNGVGQLVEGIKALGLDVLVTEFDVIDHQLPGEPVKRDRAVAEHADQFFSAIFGVMRPKAILTWGISDRYTWVPIWFKRSDGLKNRPLPLDDQMRPKPLMDVIRRYCTKTA